MLTPEELTKLLGLQPLPDEGGYFRETYRSDLMLPKAAIGKTYSGDRSAATAIYYLLTAETFSAIHRVPGDELFHFYMGDPIEMLQLREDGFSKVFRIGNDLKNGFVPQVVVPARTWQGARLIEGGKAALMGATMAPGFEFSDFELGSRARLAREHPKYQRMIAELTRE